MKTCLLEIMEQLSSAPAITETKSNSKNMKSIFTRNLSLVSSLLVLAGAVSVKAQNGTWTSDASGNWSDTTKWLGGTVADGDTFTADFSTINITADRTVTLDAPHTLSVLKFGDAITPDHNWILSGANTLTLGTAPAINVVNQTTTINSVIAGGNGFTKLGMGALTLGGATETITGGIIDNGGTLTLDFSAGGSPSANITDPGNALTLGGGALTINGAASTTSAQTFSATTFSSGAGTVSVVSGAGGTANLTLGALTHTAGSDVFFSLPTTGSIGTSGASITAALLGYGVVGTNGVVGDFAGLNTTSQIVAGKIAVPGSYTNNTAAATPAANSAVIEYNVPATGNQNLNNNVALANLLFDTHTTFASGWNFVSASGNKVWNLNQILVTPAVGTNNVSFTVGGTSINIGHNNNNLVSDQYNTGGILNFSGGGNVNFTGTGSYIQNGSGTVIMPPGLTTYSGQTYLNGGVTEINGDTNFNGGGTENINLNGGTVLGNTNLTLGTSGGNHPVLLGNNGGGLASVSGFTMTVASLISGATGTGPLVIGLPTTGGLVLGTGTGTANATAVNAAGTVILNNTGNTYTGGTVIDSGILQLTVNNLAVFGTSGIITLNGGTFQWGNAINTDISSQTTIINSTGGTLDVNGNNVTLANPIGNNGSGALTVKSTAVGGALNLSAANTYTGGTTVSSGTLNANNTSGSATGSGNVTVASGATLGGTGTISGSVTWQSGSSALFTQGSTLTVGVITLNNNSVTVNVPGITPLAPGTYTLMHYTTAGSTGSFNTGTPTYTGAGVDGGTISTVSTSAGTVTLTVTSSGITATWINDVNGNWSDATKWSSNPTVPSAAGDAATLGVGSSLRTVTLNANETVGQLSLTNANSFVVANSGKTLTLDNKGAGVAVSVTAGTLNAIQTALSLNDNTTVTVSSNDSLTVSGIVTNSLGVNKTLAINGAGITILSAANSYGPASAGSTGTTLSGGGTLQVGNGGALGAGDLSVSGNSTLQAGASVILANKIVIPSGTATLDNNGNNLTLNGGISGVGSLIETNNGTLTLGGINTYSGSTTVNAGILSISSPSNVVNTASIILNGGDLLGNGTFTMGNSIGIGATGGTVGTNALIDAASGQTFTLNGIIASAGNTGTNNLTVNSLGNNSTVILSGATTFNGATVIANGTLEVSNNLALQNSTLNYNTGSLTFGSGITNPIMAAVTGTTASQNLSLTNLASAAVTLTVNGSNVTNSYAGNLSGSGSFLSDGVGSELILSNATYTGNTTVFTNSTLVVDGGSFGSPSSTIIVGGGTFAGTTGPEALLIISNATATAGTANIGNTNNATGSSMSILGTSSATFTNSNFGAAINTLGTVLINTIGNVGLGTTTIGKDGGNGLAISNGIVTATSMDVQGSGTSTAANANLNISGGSLTITTNTAGLKIGDVNSSNGTKAGHGGNLTMIGGTLIYTNNLDGLLAVASAAAGNSNQFGNVSISGSAVAILTGLTLNYTNLPNVTSTLMVTNGGALYLGSVGLVLNPSTGGNVSAIFGTATIGALANWASSAPIALTNDAVGGPTAFRAADSNGVSHNITLNGVLSGPGSLVKRGSGTLTLTNANIYTGSTTVSNGTLVVNGSSTDASVLVLTNGTLGGSGIINSAVTIQGGTLAPGAGTNAAGTVLTINNTLTLNPGSTNVMKLSIDNSTNDSVVSSGTITYGGVLTVVTNGSDVNPFINGQKFTLFVSSSYSGSFATSNLPPLSAGLAWSNSLAIDGSIEVISSGIVPPPAPVAAFTVSATNLFATQSVVFTNTTAGSVTNSAWVFGDGNTTNTAGVSVTNNVSDTYSNAGTYLVVLTASGAGGTSTATNHIVVKPKPVINRPALVNGSLVFGGSNGVPFAPYRIWTFTNLATNIVSWTVATNANFDANGAYAYTNAPLTNKASFFRLSSP